MTTGLPQHPRRMWTRVAAAAMATLLVAFPAGAQHWKNIPLDGVPLGSDGRPDMSARAPGTPSERPDLSGIYQPNYRSIATRS